MTVKDMCNRDLNEYMDVSPEVQGALADNKPVVALESTIISHGFSYPQNLECAKESEQWIRKYNAVPATIAIIGGRVKIGLSESELEYMATNREIPKASRRDVPILISLKNDGAATVATTMIFANTAGIKVFATGGIGGVHRNGQYTFDISADLEELADTGVAVVCAGAKSILDIGLTLEYLETHGVPTVGYKTDDFPGFYTAKSGYKVDRRIDSIEDIARCIKTKEKLGLKGGIIVANPIPEESEMDYDLITRSIDDAIAEAESKGIKGKDTTPFLLERIHTTTGGKSVDANKQLVFNNARLAAQIAAALIKL